ncbi:MAG: 2-amino-4-hydroxy-6-hydroxymethyldihydropteridine diphosphokinase [Treponema sp.]|nr:2-amino-4-hydroxy-6-hydroxymethyldihydropteridine diphosphokinase [Spirochaetia bacterium]MDD7459495.1 2-amino-4-hydroxy-6-hydroxymethyldihydropteridine diphosphokinase [Spirochaetales bacterium]MDY5811005.1 2-amino-4-hydroxy-6-hydroxymethyldihydropteridine diphosphokinase [Treponema sp.]MEE1180947.1 2-amino-4-hydroxy-6-hydroxymethyldihydropteridine diphosphokinase [Treponema sp.]
MFVVLGLGSNKSYGPHSCRELLSMAIERTGSFVDSLCVSSVYRTAPMYVTDQDYFYNMVIAGNFRGSPRELLEKIHIVEAELGRDRTKEIRNGPRSIDIDIEIFGKEAVSESDLIIPHERLTERAFVLKPLVEILKTMEKNADKRVMEIPFALDFLEEKLKATGNQGIEKLS